MAKTFTLTSQNVDGRYLQLTCTQTSNGATANTSTIKWTLSSIGGYSNYYDTGATSVKINDKQVYYKGRVTWDSYQFPAAKGSVSGELIVPHDEDGSKTINVSLSTAIFYAEVQTHSGKWELDKIDRYAKVEVELNSKTETSIKLNWTSDSNIDYISYSTNNGSTWSGYAVDDIRSGLIEITGLTDGTDYDVKVRAKRSSNQLVTETSRIGIKTYDYPYCTSSPNFIVGEKLTLTLYNPLFRTVTIEVLGANNTVLATDIMREVSIEGYVTESFINNCYESIPNNTSSTYKVRVTYEGHVKVRNTGNTYTLDLSKCKPVFNDFDYKDSNTTVTGVTGNDRVFVKGFSTLQVIVDTNNKMVAQKGATNNKYIAVIDTLNASGNYSDTSDVNLNVGTLSNAGTKRLTVSAYDSRNNFTSIYKDILVYDYVKPTVYVEVSRLNNFEKETTLKVNGLYDKLTIDNVDKNSIVSVQYRYREKGGSWNDWATINTTLSNGKFTCNDVILSLDIGKEFDIEVLATDKLDSGSETGSVGIGESIFFISTNKKACYINNQKISTDIDGKVSKNLFDKNLAIVSGYYISDTGGVEVSDTSWYQATYIKVEPSTSYVVSCDIATLRVAHYDKDRNFISRQVSSETALVFTTPTNCEYIRISGKTNGENTLQIELGDTKTSYEDYYKPTVSLRDSNKTFKDVNILSESNIIDIIYPIGSIYLSVNDIPPGKLFGGRWTQLKDRFLLGAGDSYTLGTTGGEANHTLTIDEIPAHTHQNKNSVRVVSGTTYYVPGLTTSGYDVVTTGSTGGGKAHNNMPPYLVVNIWQRIG